jgi:hypothetical protein
MIDPRNVVGIDAAMLVATDAVEFLHDIESVRSRLRGARPFYVYVLYKPDRSPFYVGKGVGSRVLQHEAEARNTVRLSHKLNVIRSIHRKGQSVVYKLDSFFDDETDALSRERELIQTIGRHDLGKGTLTNQTNGGEGTSNPSEESRQRRRESLWGENAEDLDRQVANRFFQTLTSVRSVTLKAANSFGVEPLWRNRDKFRMSPRQAATIVASAIGNRVLLEPGALVPRRVRIEETDLVIENGAGRDMLSSEMVTLANSSQGQEVLCLTELGYRYIVAEIDNEMLIDAGILAVE